MAAATILIVDDEPLNRTLLEALLEPEGYRTTTASSGAAALSSVAECAPDLILLDIMMPNMDGYEVTARLKADPASCNIPVILVTAEMDRSARLAGLKAGAEEFLTKPVEKTELYLRIRNLLRLKAYSDLLSDNGARLEHEVEARTADLSRVRTAMDATADAIFLVDGSTMRVLEVNQTATDLLGYSEDEFLAGSPLSMATWLESVDRLFDGLIAGTRPNELIETRIFHRDGRDIPVELHLHVEGSRDEWILVCVMRDITTRQAVDKRLHQLAHFDAVTSLANRTLFRETLDRTIIQGLPRGWTIGVAFIDLDRFKDVNDTLGHEAGDELLRQVGDRLVGCVRVRDTVGRLGGDEFALMFVNEDGQRGAEVVADKIRACFRQPFDVADQLVNVSASIGITICPDDASDAETLIKYADTAMYRAKDAGRNQFRFFTAQMNDDVVHRLELETALIAALENREFVLHYQPKIDVDTGRITGVEALLRWDRPGHGLVSPGEFIPRLEETGLIVDVGEWVIAAACEQIARWIRSPVGPLQVAVNVSGRQFVDGNLEATIISALETYDVPGHLLELELTESTLMANTDETLSILGRLKERGLKISIDDFGTGYSSLAYLCRFPIDKLKIDIALIRNITTSEDDAAIALAIIQMAHSLKLQAIAEGVETSAQLAHLRDVDCDQVQGFYFSRPLSAIDLDPQLRDLRSSPPRVLAAV